MSLFDIGGSFIGSLDVLETRQASLRGLSGVLRDRTSTFRGVNIGIENDNLRRYELFAADGEEPDFTASPLATSATLPFDYELGDGDWFVVVRLRNGYGLTSANQTSTRILIEDGEQSESLPDAPVELRVSVVGWTLRAEAFFLPDTRVVSWVFRVTQNGTPSPVIQDLVIVPANYRDGLGVGIAEVELDDDVAFPGQNGTVIVAAFARMAGDVDGLGLGATTAAPGSEVAGVDGALWDSVNGPAWRG